MKPVFWMFLMTCSVFFPSLLKADSSEDLRVEGIMYDDTNPDNSVAVIYGNFVKKGDTVSGYKVVEVKQNSVRVASEAGQESEVGILGGGGMAAASGASGSTAGKEGAAGGKTASEQVMDQTMQAAQKGGGGFGQFFSNFNPLGVLNLAWETSAMADMKQVWTATQIYFQMNEKAPKDIKELVDAGVLAQPYADGTKGQYKFYLESKGYEVGVHADPTDPKSGMRYFFIDHEGTMRVAKGEPASAKSAEAMP